MCLLKEEKKIMTFIARREELFSGKHAISKSSTVNDYHVTSSWEMLLRAQRVHNVTTIVCMRAIHKGNVNVYRREFTRACKHAFTQLLRGSHAMRIYESFIFTNHFSHKVIKNFFSSKIVRHRFPEEFWPL